MAGREEVPGKDFSGLPLESASLLKQGDLVDDRELKRGDDDRFEHQRIADQLVELATSVDTPANVALYGPWGSGKTGIANLMKAKLKMRKGVKFARFDAFKYAENPLRRTFVTAVANELKVRDSKYHADLYSGRTRTDIRVPAAQVGKLIGVFASLILALVIILAAAVALIAWVQSGSFLDNFKAMSSTVVTAGLLPAALLAGLITLVGKSLQVDRSLAKPDSDEQFEHLLADLVADSKAERVVIFVDELDRCTSDDVVATLDAVRTFLGVHRCVFVVAADQHVLEEALSRKSRQATPADTQNPYYSTGSAYLDKVFQYQISLPNLLPPNITEFAYSLVKDRKTGLWSELNNVAFVISVLVPSHVTSPRRVKHLLNTFALAYRLAEDRHRTGHLREDPANEAVSLARLACLRVEFPLFARDLTIDADLPAHVLAAVEGLEIDSHVSDEVAALVKSYADNEKSPANFIVTTIEDDSGGSTHADLTQVRNSHHRQLLNYLQRTGAVEGPSRDLIFLQSEESLSGIDDGTAKALITAAEDGNSDTVADMFSADRIPKADHEAALRYLTTRMRHALGIAAENIAQTLLLLAERQPGLPYASIADEALNNVVALSKSGSKILTTQTVPGAWHLALVAQYDTTTIRHDLIQIVNDDSDAAYQFILASPEAALANPAATGRLLARGLLSSDLEATLDTLRSLNPQDFKLMLGRDNGLPGALAKAFVDYEAAEKAAKGQAEAAAASAVATAGGGEETIVFPVNPAPAIEGLGSLAKEVSNATPESAYVIVHVLLDIDNMTGRNQALKVLAGLPKASSLESVRRILNAVSRRVVSDWPAWLDAVEAGPYSPAIAKILDKLVEKLWKECSGTKPPSVSEVRSVASALHTLVEPLATSRPDLTADVIDKLNVLVETETEAVTRQSLMAMVKELTRHEFVDSDQLSAAQLLNVTETVRSDVAAGDLGDTLNDYVRETAMEGFADQVSRYGLQDPAREFLAALNDCGWLETPVRIDLTLDLLGTSKRYGVDVSGLLPASEVIQTLVDDYPYGSAAAVEKWLGMAVVTRQEATELLEKVISADIITDELAVAFGRITTTWTGEDRLAFIEPYIAKPASTAPNSQVLTALGFAQGPDGGIVDLLVSRYSGSTNNTMRSAVLDLWAAANITIEKQRTRLFLEVLIPMIELKVRGNGVNSEAVKIVLRHMSGLGKPPREARSAFDNALKAAIDGNDDLKNSAAMALQMFGYRTRKAGLFRQKEHIDFDSSVG